MNKFTKRYQYWWHTGEGYALEEFDAVPELFELLGAYPTTNFYLTERLDYLPPVDLTEREEEENA